MNPIAPRIERFADLAAVNQTTDARIAELTAIVKMLERTLYGARSERLRSDTPSDEQIAFVFDEIATGMSAVEAELAKAGGQDKPNRAPRPRKEFGAHVERVEIVVEPEVRPGCEGLEKVLIGEDVSRRLDVTPAKFCVIVTRRPKYVYRNRDGVLQAPPPVHLIERGLPTEALLAQIAVAKYADGLPLYRQEAIYARDDVDLDRSRNGWARSASNCSRRPTMCWRRSSRANGSSPTRRPCQRSLPDPARRKRPGCGPVRATIAHLAASVHRWSLIASRTAAAVNASSDIRRALPASCKSTAMPPTIGSPGQQVPMRA